MTKKYYADIFFYSCRDCHKPVIGKMYFAVFDRAEIGAAKQAGLVTYQCTHADCRTSYPSNRQMTNGEITEVPMAEALSEGLAFESKGSA
jgi:hypothetical protein